MRAGTLNDRIRFQTEVADGGDATWGKSKTWVDVTTVWASIVAANSDEVAEVQGVQTRTTYTIRTRFIPGITSLNRIVRKNGQMLDIVGVVDPTGRRRELEIKAVERPIVEAT